MLETKIAALKGELETNQTKEEEIRRGVKFVMTHFLFICFLIIFQIREVFSWRFFGAYFVALVLGLFVMPFFIEKERAQGGD